MVKSICVITYFEAKGIGKNALDYFNEAYFSIKKVGDDLALSITAMFNLGKAMKKVRNRFSKKDIMLKGIRLSIALDDC